MTDATTPAPVPVPVTRLDELVALAAPGVAMPTDASAADVVALVAAAGRLDAFVDLLVRDAAAQPAIGVADFAVPPDATSVSCPACGRAELEVVDQLTRWQPVRGALDGALVVDGVGEVDDGTGSPALRCAACRATWSAPEYVDPGF
jgi:hypothetical protein